MNPAAPVTNIFKAKNIYLYLYQNIESYLILAEIDVHLNPSPILQKLRMVFSTFLGSIISQIK